MNIFYKAKNNLSDALRSLLCDILAFISFSLLAVIMTFPLFFKINHCIAGFFSTDEPSIWYMWWLKYSYLHKIPSGFSHLVAAPFGVDLSIFDNVYPLWVIIKKLLVISFNGIFTYNFEVLMGFVLSGFFVYLLVRYLIRNTPAAIFSGIIFAFCPYHFVRAWQHLGLAHTQWIPLLLLAIFILKDRINKKNIAFAFFSLYLVFAFDLYYAYFSLIIIAVFIIYLLLKEQRKSFKLISWVTIISLANMSILAIRLIPLMGTIKRIGVSPTAWGFVRPFADLFSQSARPLSYFLSATVHPIFGKFTEQFIGSSLYGQSFTEHTLYLGWIPLILMVVAIRRWKRMRRDDFCMGFFICLLIVAWFFSQPPWWKLGPIKIFMPSFFMYKILPIFRAYCRFGIVVMLAVAVLSGFGLKSILEKFKTKKAKMAITALFFGLVLFEFWNYPPFKVIDLSRVPAVYYWLKEEPKDMVIAEYPLDADSPNEMYKFYQTVHEKKIINGTIPGTYANKVAQEITKLSLPYTSSVLKWMGVKYSLVHRQDYLNTDLVEDREELEKLPHNLGLKLIKSFPSQECSQKNIMCVQKTGPIDVYEVIAQPIKPKSQEE